MQQQKDKQNIIRNSRLQSSIRPFVITRQDMTKSKSVDKTRKGISRVKVSDLHTSSHQQLHLPQLNSNVIPLSHTSLTTKINQNIQVSLPVTANKQQIYHHHHPYVFTQSTYTSANTNTNNNMGNMNNLGYNYNSNVQNSTLMTLNKLTSIPPPQINPNINYNSNLIQNTQIQSAHTRNQTNNQPNIQMPSSLSPSPSKQTLQNKQIDYIIKIQLIQKQLIVLDKQNQQLKQKNKQLQYKSTEICQINQHLIKQIKQLQQLCQSKNKINIDKQQQIKNKQKYVNQLIEINRNNQNKLTQFSQHIHKISIQLEEKTNKIIDYQHRQQQYLHKIKILNVQQQQIQQPQQQHIQQPPPYSNTKYNQQQIINFQKSLTLLKSQKSQLQQSYRKLLLKSSTLQSQKQSLQFQLKSLSYQHQNQYNQYKKITQQFKLIQIHMLQLQKQAIFGRACRQQFNDIQYIRQSNQQMKIKIKQLQQRRLNQIQFHQEQIKRIQYKIHKQYQQIINKYKIQIKQLNIQIQILNKYQKQNKNNKIQNYQIINNIKQDYQNIVIQLRNQIDKLREQIKRNKDNNQYVRKQKYRQEQKQKQKYRQEQVQQLIHKLQELKQDNNFLMNKLEEQKNRKQQVNTNYNKNIPNSIINPQISQLPISLIPNNNNSNNIKNSQLQNLQKQLSSLQKHNTQITNKLFNFQSQYIKLQNKINILQIDSQKYKSKQQSNQRKIKHLTEQLNYLTNQRNIWIQDKVKIVQQLQINRLEGKEKDQKIGEFQDKVNSYRNKLEVYENKQKKMIQNVQSLNKKLENSQAQVLNTKKQLTKIQTQILVLTQQIGLKSVQIQALKQSLITSQQQNNLQKQKLLTKQYHSQKQSSQKQTRISIYRQYFILLNIQSEYQKSCYDQILLLQMLTKHIKSIMQFKKQYEQKITKLQTQYKQMVDVQTKTRLLAHTYQQKCSQLQVLLVRMEQAHNDKIALVKQDYDVVYSKYMKYRNIVVAQGKERSREKAQRGQRRY